MIALDIWGQKLEISPRDQQVWIIWPDGKRGQVTHGPENAASPAWSPDMQRIAWFRYCPEVKGCEPALVVGDRAGKPIREFSLAPEPFAGRVHGAREPSLVHRAIGWQSHIAWTDAAAFELRCGEATYRFALDKTGRLLRREN